MTAAAASTGLHTSAFLHSGSRLNRLIALAALRLRAHALPPFRKGLSEMGYVEGPRRGD